MEWNKLKPTTERLTFTSHQPPSNEPTMNICHSNDCFAVLKGQSLNLVKHRRTVSVSDFFCVFVFLGGHMIKEAQIGRDLPECSRED